MSSTVAITEHIESAIKEKLDPLWQEIHKLRQELSEVTEFAHFANKKYEETAKLLEKQEAKSNELLNENKVLISTIQEMETKLTNLSDQHNDLEQYGRRECLEIQGIPQTRHEDTNDIVMKVGNLIGVEVDESDISVSHRLPVSKRYKGKRSNPPIIVRFVRRDLKEDFYSSRKDLKGYSTEDLGLGYETTNNIYINESLTERNKLLFKEALKAKKDLKYNFAWTSNGKIHLRKDSDSKIVHIKNKEDIKELYR